MISFDMSRQGAAFSKRFLANPTLIWFLGSVCHLMGFELRFVPKASSARFTFIRPLACMNPFVNVEEAGLSKRFVAHIALMRLLTGVRPHVTGQGAGLNE